MRDRKKKKPKLLLHICCAGCGAYVCRLLMKDYCLAAIYYNPSIYPASEYKKRLAEVKMITKKMGINLIIAPYDHHKWLLRIKGHEQDKERGGRCLICYEDRMSYTAQMAKARGYKYFSTTLTISPHKDARAISRIGNILAAAWGIEYLDRDFKKQDGFKKSVELSKELGLYRQNYCGCEFSRSLDYRSGIFTRPGFPAGS